MEAAVTKHPGRPTVYATLLASLALCSLSAPVRAQVRHASGGGIYSPAPGILSQFQLSEYRVQCKIGHAVLGDGTVIQMLMFSTSVDSVTFGGNSVTIAGSMVSITDLRFPDGTKVRLTEAVPYSATATDNGNVAAGQDTFALTVHYTDDPNALDQHDLFVPGFGDPDTTFGGTLTSGNVTVK